MEKTQFTPINPESLEAYASHLVRIDHGSIPDTEIERRDEIEGIVDLLSARTRVWERMVEMHKKRANEAQQTVARLKALTENLGDVVKHLKKKGEYPLT